MKLKKSFYRKLRQIANQFNWNVCAYGKIRGIPKDNPRDRYGSSNLVCPISAINYAKTKNLVSIYEWRTIAKNLKIDLEMAKEIVAAADNNTTNKQYSKLTAKTLRNCLGLKIR